MEQEELDKGLWRAVRDKSVDDVAEWIKRGANVKSEDAFVQDNQQEAEIPVCVANGDLMLSNTVKEETTKSFDKPLSELSFTYTPLHLGALYGKTETCRLLILSGSDLTARDNQRRTPLHMAAEIGATETCQLLISSGSDLTARDYKGLTPLHLGARDGNTETCKLLISSGSDLTARDDQGRTPLHLGAANGNTETCKLLISSGSDLTARDNQEMTPLHLGAWYGRTETCKLLISSGSDLTVREDQGRTPLHLGATYGKTETCKLLISSGSDLTARDNQGRTPLHLGASAGHTETCNLLISSGSDLTARDNQGRTPLHLAAMHRETETCKMLISSGSDLTARDGLGRTPLHLGAINGEIETCQLFISSGSDLTARDGQGRTPLHLAAEIGATETCKLLISSGSDLTTRDSEGRTPLHLAAVNGHTETCKLLISSGSDLTTRDYEGRTPLHLGAANGNTETCKLLISSGSDLTARDNQGKTPLHIVTSRGHSTLSAFFKKIINAKLPKEVQYLSVEDCESFGSLLKAGFFKSYVGKIMTVGHEAVGKTTITDVLRGRKPSKIRMSTEGIDVHTYQAAVDIEQKLWIKRELLPYDVAYRNLMLPSSFNTTEIENLDLDTDIQNNSTENIDGLVKRVDSTLTDEIIWKPLCEQDASATFPLYDSKRSVLDRFKDLFKPKVRVDDITTEALHRNSIKISKKVLVDKALVPVTMWDFAGQAAFYSTHQTFLTYRGIYIIPINVSIGFDDKIETESFIPGRHGKPTSREFIFFWICSILSYSKGGVEGYPKIIPVLTHKDKLSPEHIEARVNYIYKEIKIMFGNTPWIKHLVLDKHICLNAIDSKDPGYEVLQNVLVDCLCSQPSWGEQLPKAWIPLQLAINVNRENGRKIVAINELLKENETNPVKVLSQKELLVFLKIMHAQGDILFFPLTGLRDYVIISPSFFVDALKSLVTHKRFVKGIRREVLHHLNETGRLQREELFNIWKDQKEFWKYREHLLAVMIHLDIISVPRIYTHSGTLVYSDFLYVPSLINKVDNTSYTTRTNLQVKVMAISFKFQSVIPPAVGNRLIASCTDMFEVKNYESKSMLFSGMVVLSVKKNLDLVVILRGDRIDVFLVHDEARFYIVQDTVVGLFECVTDILSTISESFKRVSSNDSKAQHLRPFSVEYPCFNMESPCYNTTKAIWNCRHGHTLDETYFSKWTIDRRKETCVSQCQGTHENDFQHKPSELQLSKLCLELSWPDLYQVMIYLGMKNTELKAIEEDHGRGYKAMFLCLRHWKRKNDGKIGDLHKALTDSKVDVHLLCKMNRDRLLGTLPDYLRHKTEPSDKDLDMIAAEVIEESILLAVQLGQQAKDWLQMKADNFKIVKINREILGRWRQEKTTRNKKMEEIAQALCNVGIHISSILQEECQITTNFQLHI